VTAPDPTGDARYRAIVEDHPEMVCRFRVDGTLTFVNRAYCRFFGRGPDELVGRPYAPVVHPDDRPAVEAALAALTPSEPVTVVENRVFRADGAVRWTQWTNHAIYDEGRLVEFQATGRDVTESRRAEADAARLAALVAGADDAIVGKTLDGIITSWNPAAERLFGWSATEALGAPIGLVVPPERADEEARLLARVRTGEAIRHVETERVARDGRRIPVSVTLSPVVDAQGRIIGVSSITSDTTERREAERQRRANVRRLEVLYRLVDEIARADSAATVCQAAVDALLAGGADRAGALLADGAGALRFTAWRNMPDDLRAAVAGRLARAPGGGCPGDAAEAVPGAAAVIAEAGLVLALIPLVDQGRVLGVLAAAHDPPRRPSDDDLRLAATIARHVAFGVGRVRAAAAIARLLAAERLAHAEAQRARTGAEAASRAKDEFLAMLAHELRNPLSVIVNALAVVGGRPTLPADLHRPVAAARRQADHLARLVDDLLDVARIRSGRLDLEPGRVDLGTIVEQAVEGQRHRIEAKAQRLALSLPERPLTVVGDAGRLHQAIGNLVNNASKYTPPGGLLRVAVETDGRWAVVRVRDDGAGIPADLLEAIFEPFTQVNPTPARTDGGLGLGLTIVRRLVEAHGGGVRASSAGPGRGSEFVVTLPLDASSEPPAPEPPAAGAPPRRILVIEDHEDGREMLAAALRLAGHDVQEAATGEAGLRAALERRPDVALIDIGLPDVPGYEVGRRLRETFGGAIRLVALTGYGQPQDRARSAAAGFDAHLVKPVDPRLLGETLQRLG
jgi:PAS domain S-box-containing protein